MLIVFLVVFIDLLGFGIVLPLAPRYAREYMGGWSDNLQGVMIGAIYSSFSLMQFVFSPVLGRVSDRVGRRPVMILSLTGSVVFYGLFAVASSLSPEQGTLALILLLLSRVGAGIAGASVSTASAVIADCTTRETRAKGMGLIGAAFGFGFTFGPLIAYLGLEFFQAAHWGPGALAAGLSAVALALAVWLMPETRPPGSSAGAKEYFSLRRTREVLAMPDVGRLVLVYFLVIFGFATFEGTLALFTADAFKLDEKDNFLVFAYVGFVLMVAQGGFYRRLAGKRSERQLMGVGVGMMLLGFAGLLAVAVGGWLLTTGGTVVSLKTLFYLSVTVAVFGFAFVNPSVSALVSKSAPPDRQGEVQGVNQSFSALGRIAGPVTGLMAFAQHPSRGLPYALGILILGVVAVILANHSPQRAGGAAEEDTNPR